MQGTEFESDFQPFFVWMTKFVVVVIVVVVVVVVIVVVVVVVV